MHDEDAFHPNKSLQQKLQHIYELRRDGGSRVNFEDNSYYKKLLNSVDNPQDRLPPVIHVAGTNGKGSVIATLRAILEAQGYKVHAYTSPHLLKFNERLYVAGKHISDEELDALLNEIFERNGDNPVTFFEFTTTLAFLAFSRTPADVVLLETGMGGRLDCSNIVKEPLCTVIMPVSYDHMEFLGDTIAKIAGEKAGIIKDGVPCILAPQEKEALEVFQAKAKAHKAPLFVNGRDWFIRRSGDDVIFNSGEKTATYHRPSLVGEHQIYNAGTALATLEVVKDTLPVSVEAVNSGMENIIWPGRMERKEGGQYSSMLPSGWELWFDCGHNVAGAQAIAGVLQRWREKDTRPVHVLLGMKENKDIQGVINILEPLSASLTEFSIGDDLKPLIQEIVKKENAVGAKVLVCGSLYSYSHL